MRINTILMLVAGELPVVVAEKEGKVFDWLFLRNVLVFIVCVVAVVYVLFKIGVFDKNKPAKKMHTEQQNYNKEKQKRKLVHFALSALEGFAQKVGGGISDAEKYAWEFRILRMMQTIDIVGRKITPIEMVGLLRFITFLCVSVGIAGVLITGNLVFIVFVIVGLIVTPAVKLYCDMTISEQDKAIERDFTDFYLLVHSRLMKGTQAHIASALQEYLNICDETMTYEDHRELRDFVAYLLATITLMGDEYKAVLAVRDKYKSAAVINFCNIASQALQGVDNANNLLQFKIEMVAKQKAQVRIIAEQRAEKAMKSIYAVWAILAEFVIIVMITRLQVVF